MKHIITAPAHGALYHYYNDGTPETIDLQPGKQSVDGSIEEGAYIRRLWDDIVLHEPESHNNNTTLHVLDTGCIESPPKKRYEALNKLSHRLGHENVLAVLLHLNADGMGAKWTEAHGHKVFHNGKYDALEQANRFDVVLKSPFAPLRTKSRGVKKHGFSMLNGLKCAAVLVELDFMTNLAACTKLRIAQRDGTLADFLSSYFMEVRGI